MLTILHSEILLLLGVLLIFGFYVGGVARKLRMPSLIGFMLMGVVLGPSVLGIISEHNLESLSFVTEIALGFVAFSIGAELSVKSLRRLGKGIISIILAESFCAFFVVMLSVYALTRSWPMALLFGAVAPASAPAGTVAVIQEYRAKGSLTKALYAIVGFDDALAILIFGLSAALAKVLLLGKLRAEGTSGGLLSSLSHAGMEIAVSIIVGAILGYIFCWLTRRLTKGRDLLIMTFGIVFVAAGLATHFHFSLILTNMVIGFVLINTRRDAFAHKVTQPLGEIMPMIFLLFFCKAGAHLDIRALPSLGMIGIVYILARSLGLISGARLGAIAGHVEDKIKNYAGLGILSQAGVAIGLSLIISHDFNVLVGKPAVATALQNYAAQHPGLSGLLYNPLTISGALLTTVTASCIIFEIVGPLLTKVALQKAGEIPNTTQK